MSDRTYLAGDLCVYCCNDTMWGSGRFINRIPALIDMESSGFLKDAPEFMKSFDLVDGYACAECMSFDCAECGEVIPIDEDELWKDGRFHVACLPEEAVL